MTRTDALIEYRGATLAALNAVRALQASASETAQQRALFEVHARWAQHLHQAAESLATAILRADALEPPCNKPIGIAEYQQQQRLADFRRRHRLTQAELDDFERELPA